MYIYLVFCTSPSLRLQILKRRSWFMM